MAIGNWQPISAAPLTAIGDSPVDVLLYGESFGICLGRIARYADGYTYAGVSHIGGNLTDYGAIFWMPLPSPPSPSQSPAVGRESIFDDGRGALPAPQIQSESEA